MNPGRIAVINDEFRPSEHDVDRAHRALLAIDEAEKNGVGVIELDGELVAMQSGRDMANQILTDADAY